MHRGLRLIRISGIEVVADWSLLVIFGLVTLSLAFALFPAWHPQWSLPLRWATSLSAAVLFFSSVLAHELAHAVVGRRGGVRVRRITLFIFGGMAQTENEPPSWQVELRMALAGPAVSIAIGLICLTLTQAGLAHVEGDEAQIRQFLAGLSPGATILLWLGWINIILGVFNLVPGFPLDGGRALRALVWAVTGNLRRATRVASALGQAFAWILIGIGLAMMIGARVPVFGHGPVNGLWLALIGWFLNNAAMMSYRQLLVSDALNDTPVARLMRTVAIRLDPGTQVDAFVDRYALASGQEAFPVEQNGRFLGMVTLRDVHRFQRGTRHGATVVEIMTPVSRLPALSPGQSASDAIGIMGREGVDQLPVIEHERLVGVLSREDLLKWMSLRLDRARGREQARDASSAAGTLKPK